MREGFVFTLLLLYLFRFFRILLHHLKFFQTYPILMSHLSQFLRINRDLASPCSILESFTYSSILRTNPLYRSSISSYHSNMLQRKMISKIVSRIRYQILRTHRNSLGQVGMLLFQRRKQYSW